MLFFFFFNDTATTEIYTLSLHDALPILLRKLAPRAPRSVHVIPSREVTTPDFHPTATNSESAQVTALNSPPPGGLCALHVTASEDVKIASPTATNRCPDHTTSRRTLASVDA